MKQGRSQNLKGVMGLISIVVIAVVALAFIHAKRDEVLTGALAPTDLSQVEMTAPLPEIDPALIDCNNWSQSVRIEPGMVIEGPAAIYPFVVPREWAAALGLKWRPEWGFNIMEGQTLKMPESLRDSSTGEAVVPDGIVRYFATDLDVTIAEVSNFADECK